MLFDLHMHSRFSVDALTKPETIVKICKKNAWAFSLTDHNNMGAYQGANSITKLAKKNKVFLVPGEEVKVVLDSGKIAGEVVVYFLNKPIIPCTFEEIIDEVKSQDALLSCPHPFDWPRKNFKEFRKKWRNFDAMEVYNARAYYQGLNKTSQNFFEKEAFGKISALAVSDAHTPEEIGNGLTQIDANNEQEFRLAIKKGKTIPIQRGKANIWHHFQTQLARKNIAKPR